MAKITENVLGYCDDCGDVTNDLVIIEAIDDDNAMGFCSKCIDDLVGKLTDRYITSCE